MVTTSRSYVISIAVIWVFCVNCQHLVHVGDSTDADDGVQIEPTQTADQHDMFVATNEWKVIKEGQHVPPGLHYRINLETGLKEAKLLDNADSEENVEPNMRRLSPALEEALKNIATSHDEPSGNQEAATDGTDSEQPRKTFRSLDEIKAEFSKQNYTLSSEQEILTNLYKSLTSKPETSRAILEDLEYYLHGIDNAQYFTDLGGTSYLAQLLNSTTEEDLLAQLALTIGSACQSNQYVSRVVLKENVIQTLLRHLHTPGTSVKLQNRCLFALSSVLRTLPESMDTLLTHGGLQTFRYLVTNSGIAMKTRVKVYTLLTDLIALSSDGSIVYKFNLYNQSIADICNRVAVDLESDVSLDHIEKLLLFIQETGSSLCKDIYRTTLPQLKALRQKLRLDYHEELAEYYTELINHVDTLLHKAEAANREEL